MGKKRTRHDKVIAHLRRQVENKPVELEKKPVIQSDFYQPEVILPEVGLKQDLTRTGIVTILALVLLFIFKLIERR